MRSIKVKEISLVTQIDHPPDSNIIYASCLSSACCSFRIRAGKKKMPTGLTLCFSLSPSFLPPFPDDTWDEPGKQEPEPGEVKTACRKAVQCQINNDVGVGAASWRRG